MKNKNMRRNIESLCFFICYQLFVVCGTLAGSFGVEGVGTALGTAERGCGEEGVGRTDLRTEFLAILFLRTDSVQASRRGNTSGLTMIPLLSRSAQALIIESCVEISRSLATVLANVLQSSMAEDPNG